VSAEASEGASAMPVQSRAASNWSRRQNGIAQPGVTASGASSGAGADVDAAPEEALAGSGGGGSDDARASAAASADGASRGGAVLADGRGSALYVAIGGLLLAGCFCGGPAPPPAPLDWRPAKNAPAHSNAVMAGQGGARILGRRGPMETYRPVGRAVLASCA